VKPSKLELIPEAHSDSARLGGGALLPADVAWPQNPNGHDLLLVFSLPTSFVNAASGLRFPDDHTISVFTTYSKTDWFLDCVTYHGHPEELEQIKAGFTRVLCHPTGTPRDDARPTIPARGIRSQVDATDDSETIIGSKLGGLPGLLQREPLALDGYEFFLQLYSGSVGDPFRDLFGLSDAIGYLYLARDSNPNNPGVFFSQVT
jgi:hypothetical protein